jgi:hypothetical protein
MVSGAQAVGTIEPWLPEFDQNAQLQLPAFLSVLTADPIP